MLKAFKKLDVSLATPTRIILGGGAAMIAAYDIPISTLDVDGVPDKYSLPLAEFKDKVRAVGRALDIPQDWLNDYFATFLFVLPSDYETRLVPFYRGKHLNVSALGKEELIIMKCFAGREKDIPHIRALLRKGADVQTVDARLQELLEKKTPGGQKAADLFDDLCAESETPR